METQERTMTKKNRKKNKFERQNGMKNKNKEENVF